MTQIDLFEGEAAVAAETSKPAVIKSASTISSGRSDLLRILQGSSGLSVSMRQSIEDAATLVCLDALSQDVAKAPLLLKTRDPQSEMIVCGKDHPVARLFALDPNFRHTWPEFMGMFVYYLCLAGNGYAAIERTRTGDPLAMLPAMPDRVTSRISGRDTFYDVQATTQQERALFGFSHNRLPARDMLHVRDRMLDGFEGYATLKAGNRTMRLARALVDFQTKLFEDDAQFKGVFTRDQPTPLDDQAFERLQRQLKKLMSRVRNSAEPIVLEDGIGFEQLASTAEEAGVAKALDAAIAATCRLFRMPPHKALHLNAVKYENLAIMEQFYVRDTILPRVRLIESRLEKALLTDAERLEYKIEIDRNTLNMPDEETKRKWVETLVDRGIITLNQAAQITGYPLVEGRDIYIKPSTATLVDAAGNPIGGEQSSEGDDTTDEERSLGLQLITGGKGA